MRRRAVITNATMRRRLRVAAVVLLGVAGLTFCIRASRTSSSTDAAGVTTYHSMRIEHGAYIVSDSSVAPAFEPGFDWAFAPGVSLMTFRHAATFRRGGGVLESSREIGVGQVLIIVAVAAWLATLPLIGIPPGECQCGYSLVGLRGDQCPECGLPVRRDSRTS
jgi:hypothetical protein